MPKITVHGGPTNKYEGPAAPVNEAGPELVEVAADDGADLVAAVLAAIATPEPEYGAWLIADLREECARRGLPRSGNKDDLVARLGADDDARA